MKELLYLLQAFALFHIGNCSAPIIHGLPTSVNLGELEYKGRLIYELSVTDINGDSFVCNRHSVVPPPNNTDVDFRVLIDSANGKYGVYVTNKNEGTLANPNVMFDFNIEQTFIVYIACTDSRNNTNFPLGALEIDIISGDRVWFQDLPDIVQPDASAVLQGNTIYTVQAFELITNNGNGNGLSYTMTTVPSTDNFIIDGNGNVKAAKDLIFETNSKITAYITVSDGTIWVTDKLIITPTNMNNIPEITNLQSAPSIYVSETLAGGSVLATLTGSDGDATDTPLTYAFQVNPVIDTTLFMIDTTTDPPQFKLAPDKSLDYEKVTYYNVTFTVTDQKATGGPFILNIHVLNEDEPCYFDRTLYSVTAFEGPAGSVALNPGFIVRDNDGTGSTYTLSLVTGNSSELFTMDPTSGIISYSIDYNVDGGAHPSLVYMTVKCTDATGQTGTANILVNINDINDNAPAFASSEYTFSADQFTSVGSSLGVTSATDIDSGSNALYTCSYGASQNGLPANAYVEVGTDCSVFFKSRTNLAYDTMLRFTLLAVNNQASPVLTGTTYVNVFYLETSTTTSSTTTTATTTATTTTTTAAPSTLSDGDIAAIVIGSVVGAILLGLLLYALFRWCFTGFCCGPDPCDFAGCCNRNNYNYPKRQITPVRSRPELREKHYRETADEFNYYRDDSDYGSLKNQEVRNTRLPRPDRAYPDFPQVGEPQFPRLSPSDARVDMISPYYPRLPIGYR